MDGILPVDLIKSVCKHGPYLVVAAIAAITAIFRWLVLPRLARFGLWETEKKEGLLFVEGVMLLELGVVLLLSSALLEYSFNLICTEDVRVNFDYRFYFHVAFAVTFPVLVIYFILPWLGWSPKYAREYKPRIKIILAATSFGLFTVAYFIGKNIFF